MSNSTLFCKLALIYIFCSFIQPERIISYYIPAIKIINGIPTVLFYLLILAWFISDKTVKGENIPLVRLLVVFVLCVGISSILAKNTGRARIVLYPMMNFLIFYCLILKYYLNSQERFKKLLTIYLCGIIIFGVLGFMHGGKLPFIPELNDEDSLGPFFTMAIPFPAFLAMNMESKKKYIYFFMSIFCIAVIVNTNARGAGIALFVVLVYIFLKFKKKIKLIIMGTIIGILLFGFWGSYLMRTSYVTEMMTIFSESEMIERGEGTGASRMFLWEMGFKMFLKSPILGVGPNNFGVHLPEYAEKYRDEQVGLAYYGQILHNDYLEILFGTGVVGFVVFLILLSGSFKMNRKTRNMLGQMKDIETLHKDWKGIPGGLLRKYYNLTFAIEASQIALMVNMIFYGIVYYKKFYWFLLIISGSLYVLIESKFKGLNRFSEKQVNNRMC